MNKKEILEKAIFNQGISEKEACFIYEHADLSELMLVANEIRKQKKKGGIVSWLIDRNVNITNVCYSSCLFCNFCRGTKDKDAYITTTEEYKAKIDELLAIGGSQLLLQGGMHPRLGLKFYKELFSELKSLYPSVNLHALGPPEIVHISKLEGISFKECLEELISSGMDSLPGAGAEILSNRVRGLVSPNKCSTEEWLGVMREAHKLNIVTSATMMFGHLETIQERVQHLLYIRDVQEEKPETSTGFISFIPWPLQSKNTNLLARYPKIKRVGSLEYVRFFALSRIILNNIDNMQPSWLTVGKETAQICLNAGGNDFGSIMIEENVVSSAGADFQLGVEQMKNAIVEAGFVPRQRNQKYELID